MTIYNTKKRVSEEDSDTAIHDFSFEENEGQPIITVKELDLYSNDNSNSASDRNEFIEIPVVNENQAGFMSADLYQDIEDIKVEIETLFSFKISKPYNDIEAIETPQEKIIYMVKNNESYDLYLWFEDKENHFQKIGNTSLDMSNFLTTEDGLSLYEAIQKRELLSNKRDNFDDANNTTYPTTLATKTELDKKEVSTNKKTNFDNANNTTYPTTLATKTELDKKEVLTNKKTIFDNANNTTYPTTLATKTELDKKEILENKRTTFNNPDDIGYPTTRLVKSSLDTLRKQAVEIYIGENEPTINEDDGLKLWINNSEGDVFEIVDNLEHDNPTTRKSLSAYQGYILDNKKQDVLVSGENIKTINNENLLGNGNITIQGGGGGTGILPQFTFTDLQNIIDDATSGSTIYLNGYFINQELFNHVSISINKPLTIIGENCIIDGNKENSIYNCRGFEIFSDDVVIKNIKFINCYGKTAHGGAIFANNRSNCTVSNCEFANCSVHVGMQGGAIFFGNIPINCTVIDCIFKTETDTVFGITPTYTSLNNKKDGEIVTKDNLKNKSTLTFVLSDGTTETHTFYEEV